MFRFRRGFKVNQVYSLYSFKFSLTFKIANKLLCILKKLYDTETLVLTPPPFAKKYGHLVDYRFYKTCVF